MQPLKKQGSESNFLLGRCFWRALAWAADLLWTDASPELLLDHSAEAVGAVGLLMLDVPADSVGFGRVDGLRNEVTIGLLAARRVGAEAQYGRVRCQQRVGLVQGKAAVT